MGDYVDRGALAYHAITMIPVVGKPLQCVTKKLHLPKAGYLQWRNWLGIDHLLAANASIEGKFGRVTAEPGVQVEAVIGKTGGGP